MSTEDFLKNYYNALDLLDYPVWITNPDNQILYSNSTDRNSRGNTIFDVLSTIEAPEKVSKSFFVTHNNSTLLLYSRTLDSYISCKPLVFPEANKKAYLWQKVPFKTSDCKKEIDDSNLEPDNFFVTNTKQGNKNDVILNALPDMIVRLDSKGKYIDIRPPAHLRDELDTSAIIGKTMDQILPVAVANLALEKIEKVLDSKNMEVFTYTIPKDNSRKHYEARMVPCSKDEVITIISDITKRWDAEEALTASEERFRLLAENARDMIFRISLVPKRTVEYVSPICERILGYTPEDFYNNPELDYNLIHKEDRIRIDSGSIVNEKNDKPIVLRWVCKNGDIIHVEQKWVPIFDSEGKLVAIEGICRDISERIKAHEEMVKLEAELHQAQKTQAIGQLAGGVAHDFNNLLTGIVGNIELAMMDLPENSSAIEYLNESREAVKLATDLSIQMLAYSGKGHFHLQELDLSREVEVLRTFIDSYVTSQINVEMMLDPTVPSIHADKNQIKQVIMSLVSNAAEAIGNEKGTITIRTGEVSCDKIYSRNLHFESDIPSGRCSFLEVADTGCGMDVETKEKMFEPFYSTKFTGRGLGLSAVLGIVTGHKGGIAVNTEVGKGTRVTIVFPIYDSDNKVNTVDKPVFVNKHKTVLVVDDERLVRHVSKKTLLKYGYNVVLASDGLEAVEIFKQKHHEIDLVLLDLTMPRMNGEDAFYEMQKIDGQVPVVLTSGFSENVIRERFSAQSPSEFLQKPFTPGDLNNTIEKVFR